MDLKERKILVVDDEEGVRLTIEAYMEDLEANIKSVESGEDAIKIMKNWTPEVIISDLHLPGISGEELIRDLSSQFQADHFLILTGNLQYELPKDLIRLGMSKKNILTKPVYPLASLENAIENLLV